MKRMLPFGLLAVLAVALTATIVGLVAKDASTGAAFPGENGTIAFTSDRDGNSEIYVMNADGSGQTNLTNNPAFDCCPAWSPDATQIAFASGRDGSSEIYVMNSDGTRQTRLTNSPAQDSFPAWSPDGAQIAFMRNPGPGNNPDIYVMNTDGSDQIDVSSNPDLDCCSVWSPDGSRIAFGGGRDLTGDGRMNSDVYVVNADGTGLINLTHDPESDVFVPHTDSLVSGLDWSPDGTHIAFYSRRERLVPGIYMLDVESPRDVRFLTEGFAPNWSPDGSKIAFSHFEQGLLVRDVDTGNEVPLAGELPGDAAICGGAFSRWSPDSTMVLFSASPDGCFDPFGPAPDNPSDIYIVNADGSGLQNVTDHRGFDSFPDWRPLPAGPEATPTARPTPCGPEGCPTPTVTPTPRPLSGDANCDGNVNSIDAAIALQFDAGLVSSLACEANADVNADGAANSLDAALILQFDAGLIDGLPAGAESGIEGPVTIDPATR